MSDILEAELAPSGGLKTGWFDIGKSDLFRDAWVIIFYLGLMLPYAFVGLWIGTVANNEFQLPIKDIAIAIMLLRIPFFLRLIWAQPVERFVELPYGRRRSWILLGTILHIVLLIPLLFLDIRTATWLFVAVVFVALIPRLFAEQAVVEVEIAEHFVCRDVVETEVCLLGPLKAAPVFQRGIQQAECADHVGLDKGPGPVDRSIDMAFGGEVHDRIDLFFAQQTKHHLAIEDIALDEPVVGRIGDCPQAFRVARIGHLVEVDETLHPVSLKEKANEIRPNETQSTCDQKLLHAEKEY